MAFDMITKRRLFEALWERARAGQCAPSLRLIVKLAKIANEAAAERLLRDMEADGAITVVGEVGAYPWLTIRRTTYTGTFVKAPVWLEREKSEKVRLVPDEAPASTIVDILKRPQPTRDAVTRLAEYPRGESGTARKAPTVAVSAATSSAPGISPPQQEAEAIATLPAPIIAVTRSGGVRAPAHVAAFERTDRQINIRVPASVHAALSARAELEGGGAGTIARTIFLEAFDAADCDTGRRHRLSAAVLRAWREDGRPLPDFVTALIEIGLEEWSRFRGMQEAAE